MIQTETRTRIKDEIPRTEAMEIDKVKTIHPELRDRRARTEARAGNQQGQTNPPRSQGRTDRNKGRQNTNKHGYQGNLQFRNGSQTRNENQGTGARQNQDNRSWNQDQTNTGNQKHDNTKAQQTHGRKGTTYRNMDTQKENHHWNDSTASPQQETFDAAQYVQRVADVDRDGDAIITDIKAHGFGGNTFQSHFPVYGDQYLLSYNPSMAPHYRTPYTSADSFANHPAGSSSTSGTSSDPVEEEDIV